MADSSFSFDPDSIASTSDAASSALALGSDAQSSAGVAMSKASDASSAATVAQSKASDVSSALVARQRVVILKVYNEASAISTGDGKMYFAVPNELSGLDLKSCGGHLYTAATSGVVQVQFARLSAASAIDMLTSKLEWDATEKDTATAGSAAVINASYDDVATGQEVRVDIDAAGSGAKGMEVRLAFG